ncbi:MAG: tRNA (N6-isopentenyl adenosine(37)-C2)-methylthiotransferase MiaB [Anaerovoracaceae bacterium]
MKKAKTYHITTFGCQMNEHDSETIGGMLTQLGFEQSDSHKEADVAIINTCSVREHADLRFFGTLGQMKKKKQENPEFTVCVCGCMMQQQHIVDELKSKYPWVDIVFGTHNLHEFPKLLTSVVNQNQKIVEVWPEEGDIIEGLPAKRLYKHKGFVNIMYGCNNFCTYCIVPYTRGRERSRKPDDVIKEVKELVIDGVKEITLLGQNVNSYVGSDGIDFPDLLYKLNEIEGLERLRFMTSHPKDLSDKLIQAYVDCDKLCNYIHLPIQSGSNKVLEKMNRKYTREDYMAIIEKIREKVPEITVTTDFIVGFPGETEEDFQETIDLANQVGFDSAFTFLYSIRKGTPAEKYGDHIDEEVKHKRFNRLLEAINASSAIKNADYEGKIEKVLVDSHSKTDKTAFSGRTEGFKPVNLPGDDSMIGKILPVKIIKGKTFSLDGQVVK